MTLHDPAPCALDCAIDRRRFLQAAGVTAASAALAACGMGDFPVAPETVSLTMTLADYPSLATVGGVALVRASGSPIAVVRTTSDAFVALSRICPHQGGTVNQATGGWRCPRHGARFAATGAWAGGERTSDLRAYPTTYDASAGTLRIGTAASA